MATTATKLRTTLRLTRQLTTQPLKTSTEKRYVRIAGPASYATHRDVELFLLSNGITPPTPTSPTLDLVQGQSDVFQNQSVWIYDAGSASAASDTSMRISGKIAGLKLVRAAPVDKRLVDDMLAVPSGNSRRTTLRKRMNVIKPTPEERGRALLATNLPYNLSPRFLWSFFASYDVLDIRHLRKSAVACVVFASESEAFRAMRERSNLPLQSDRHQISLKMHE